MDGGGCFHRLFTRAFLLIQIDRKKKRGRKKAGYAPLLYGVCQQRFFGDSPVRRRLWRKLSRRHRSYRHERPQ